MADIGAKVSRVNVDVATASDDQLMFSSGWPSAKILYKGLATVNAASSTVVVQHDLGYVPTFLVYRVSGATSEFSSYGSVFDGSAVAYVGANTTQLKYFASGFGSGNVSFYYYILDIPVDRSFTAEVKNSNPDVTAPIGVGPGDYGLKVALDGADVSSTDLRDFAVHSAAGNLNVQMTGNGVPFETATTAGAPAVQYRINHGLGYEPLALCYVDFGANGTGTYTAGWYYMLGGVGGVSYIRFYSTSSNCRVEEDYVFGGYGSATSRSGIVVLKEPFNTVNGYSITTGY